MSAWKEYEKTMVTPPSLWSAAKANNVSMLESLLAKGLDIDARDARGFSPLMLAAYGGNVDAVDCLLTHGADPNSADLAGNSVLMGAAFKGDVNVLKKLLAAGADKTAKNASGLDACGFALTFGRTEVVELLNQNR